MTDEVVAYVGLLYFAWLKKKHPRFQGCIDLHNMSLGGLNLWFSTYASVGDSICASDNSVGTFKVQDGFRIFLPPLGRNGGHTHLGRLG